MEIAQAQREVRTTFVGGFAGQLVSGVIWGVSAGCMQWISFRVALLVLVAGGFFTFPLTQLLLRLMGREHALAKGHPMNGLAVQVAFTVPLTLPVVFAATAYRHGWFYPAFMITLGAHYLPFVFLYGMWQFWVLGALLMGSGLLIALYVPAALSLGGWITAGLLLLFAVVGRQAVEAEREGSGSLEA